MRITTQNLLLQLSTDNSTSTVFPEISEAQILNSSPTLTHVNTVLDGYTY